MFQPYEKKFKFGPNVDYRIYEMSDDNIKDLKKNTLMFLLKESQSSHIKNS